MENRISGMILGSIIGDALGTPIDGFSKGHISSIFKSSYGFVDPTPALKGKMDRWKKPGLYSSISQFIILLSCFLNSRKKFNGGDLFDFIKDLPEIPGSQYGIFRHPDKMERQFLERVTMGDSDSRDGVSSIITARLAAIIPSLVQYRTKSVSNHIYRTISISLLFSQNISSIAGAVIFAVLLKRILNDSSPLSSINMISIAKEEIASLFEEIDINTDKIFNIGINPVSFLNIIEEYKTIFMNIENIGDKHEAAENIYTYVNKGIKSPITRATVNHPMAIIPYSIYLASQYKESPSDILFHAAWEGGSTSILCTLIGALTGAAFGNEWISGEIRDGLINKKRIFSIVEAISKGRIFESLLQDFIKAEASLTIKESQEKNAKLKHIKQKPKKRKVGKDREAELSKHVVESWTKIDKAKWRKNINKQNKE